MQTRAKISHFTCLRIATICLVPAQTLHAEPVFPKDIRVVDGDTIYHHEVKYRLVGFDTPETYRPQCNFERALGKAATNRVIELINSGAQLDLVVLPGRDKYGQGLARFFVGTRDIKDLLVSEGLARSYSGGRRVSWC